MPEPTSRWGPGGITPTKREDLGEAAPNSCGEPGRARHSQQRAANASVREGDPGREQRRPHGRGTHRGVQTRCGCPLCPDIVTAAGILRALTRGRAEGSA